MNPAKVVLTERGFSFLLSEIWRFQRKYLFLQFDEQNT